MAEISRSKVLSNCDTERLAHNEAVLRVFAFHYFGRPIADIEWPDILGEWIKVAENKGVYTIWSELLKKHPGLEPFFVAEAQSESGSGGRCFEFSRTKTQPRTTADNKIVQIPLNVWLCIADDVATRKRLKKAKVGQLPPGEVDPFAKKPVRASPDSLRRYARQGLAR